MRAVSVNVSFVKQIDGRLSVTEKYQYDTGGTDTVVYIAQPDWDLQNVANSRMANINAVLERRDAESLQANNFQAPLTKRQFLNLLPKSVSKDLLKLSKTNPDLEYALYYLNAGGEVFKSNAIAWLNDLISANVLTAAQRDGILAAWTANYG